MAALTRAFFEAYTNGILDGSTEANNKENKRSPQAVKQAMLEHYEEINQQFFTVMFPALTLLNYQDEQKMQEKLKEASVEKALNVTEYLRFACKTDKLFQALLSEYRRNFTMLLQGKMTTLHEHIKGYPRGLQLSVIDEQKAIVIMVRVILKAYAAGIKATKTNHHAFNQATIYRILLINIQLLLNDCAFKSNEEDLILLFQEACGNENNLNVLFNSLDEIYEELAQEEGLYTHNEQGN